MYLTYMIYLLLIDYILCFRYHIPFPLHVYIYTHMYIDKYNTIVVTNTSIAYIIQTHTNSICIIIFQYVIYTAFYFRSYVDICI